jgi:hypothetical protein
MELVRRRGNGVAGEWRGKAEEKGLRRQTPARQQSTAGGRSTGADVAVAGWSGRQQGRNLGRSSGIDLVCSVGVAGLNQD